MFPDAHHMPRDFAQNTKVFLPQALTSGARAKYNSKFFVEINLEPNLVIMFAKIKRY